MRALHVRLEGLSASFRHPLIVSGTQISLPLPGYSNLLGMISACAGRPVGPGETRVGFEFRALSHDLELEKKDRWSLEDGRLEPIGRKKVPRTLRRLAPGRWEAMPQGIGWRQVYWSPSLDLYVTNLAFREAFDRPAATPRFGRSQDLAWIRWCRVIELEPVSRGRLGPTLVPHPLQGVGGYEVRLAEWFENRRAGEPRRLGPVGHYVALPSIGGLRFEASHASLFRPSDAEKDQDVIYLHEWLEDETARKEHG